MSARRNCRTAVRKSAARIVFGSEGFVSAGVASGVCEEVQLLALADSDNLNADLPMFATCSYVLASSDCPHNVSDRLKFPTQ